VNTFSARGVTVRFDREAALDGVDLDLEAGHATMLVGPNGAGKSTLIKVLLGLVRPDAGAFAVDGARLAIDRDWKRRIGYLPEAVAFSENLSGRQVLGFFARARGVSRGRVEEVLERVGLAHAARRALRGYSRGMRQRLGLGVAILATPELLVLDEPTSGLDQQGLGVLWSVMQEWRENGRMVLASTHDLALMERRVDDICVLRSGQVIAHGTAETLRRSAGIPHRIWLEVAGASEPRIDLLCEAMRKWGKGRIERSGKRIVVEVPGDEILEVVEILAGFSGVVSGLRVEEPSLDVVYDELVGSA
jgi:Cu-processing system ATP-binding protein